eukprot:865947-Pleurochrysis_carterae.AAC.1
MQVRAALMVLLSLDTTASLLSGTVRSLWLHKHGFSRPAARCLSTATMLHEKPTTRKSRSRMRSAANPILRGVTQPLVDNQGSQDVAKKKASSRLLQHAQQIARTADGPDGQDSREPGQRHAKGETTTEVDATAIVTGTVRTIPFMVKGHVAIVKLDTGAGKLVTVTGCPADVLPGEH